MYHSLADIHAHVVYGVDDGSRSLEMSQKLLLSAGESGVGVICCTSHCTPGHRAFPWEVYRRHLEQLQSFIRRDRLQMELYTGSEILYTNETPNLLRKGEIPTLGGSDTVLVEFLPGVPWKDLSAAVREIRNAGFRMVIAHVERYECLHEDLDRISELREIGGLMCQMNAKPVLGSKGMLGNRWARKALKNNLIDIVASDMHHPVSRPCNLRKAYSTLRGLLGEEAAIRMTRDNPLKAMGLYGG